MRWIELSRLMMLLTVGGSTAALGATPHYLPSRQIVLAYRADATQDVRAELWVSRDHGRQWEEAYAISAGPGTLRYFAPLDGAYDLYLILRNDAGTSGPPPQPGSEPTLRVIVDTVPPLLQLHEHRAERLEDGTPLVHVRASLVEENLSPEGIRVFYRTDDEDWIDGGVAVHADSELTWTPPVAPGTEIDLHVVVTDLAGNTSAAELPGVEIPAPPPIEKPDDQAAPESQPAVTDTVTVEPLVIAPVVPPASVASASTNSAPASSGSQISEAPPTLSRLRELAGRFMSEGRYSLAVARLEDALEQDPQDAGLLVDLGSALYRLRRYEEARRRFETALNQVPRHTAALEGLALVAATEKRYPDARRHLQRLLKLNPLSSHGWLRYGDIEYRLGNTASALEAWEHVLTLPDADSEAGAKARRRLKYFAAEHPGKPAAEQEQDGQEDAGTADRGDLRRRRAPERNGAGRDAGPSPAAASGPGARAQRL